MADVHDPKVRSYNMSQIKGKDTKPEILVRRYLHARGLRYRLHDKKLPGKPDLAFAKYKKAVYVHGCFWHVHEGCRYFKVPKTRTEWWMNKLNGNKARDQEHLKQIRDMGWTPIVVWECELKPNQRAETLERLYDRIVGTAD